MGKQKRDKNKTGVASNPEMAAAMLEAVETFPVTSVGTHFADETVRVGYARALEPNEVGYGTVPGPKPELLTNKLGERLAFERSGVRAYEMVIAKLEAYGTFPGGPSRDDLIEILNEEHGHFALLQSTVLDLGGDPTVVTPDADLVGVVATGLFQVLADPRTTLLSSLQALLVAELADSAGWNVLVEIARTAKLDKLAETFMRAEQTEQKHKAKVEAWIAAGLGLPK